MYLSEMVYLDEEGLDPLILPILKLAEGEYYDKAYIKQYTFN